MENTNTQQSVPAENVDPAEVAKFSDLAHQWWDETGVLHTLHAINPLRLGWIQEVAGPLRERQVLDVGCGGGILSESMAQAGAQVTGIDLAEESLRVAQLHALEAGVNNVRYQKVSVEQFAAEHPGEFDVVTCMEMLEHVPDPASVVRACAQAVKPGGWVLLSTINRNPKSFLFAILGAEYLLNLVPRGTHEYAKMITPAELMRECRESGLAIDSTRGLHYNPLTQRYWLDANVDVNYMVACRKPD
ncbi:bifunctional 2-polyprenyl-6-hydroxyphenol methylase/3-demethylubiquinol 3-O-methyltransferase UbiG [Brachymonas sp. G13]|uniref:bifunctional 2-polyprenyl-6-hydroxyphenol methylase/3-demethylubiquinol 3-O-methyltransferase UbiG n=1 Tax=Brachymonas TaxID=28219 RepID=UPI0016B18AF0|nr:bifunctional 2-polyprenyl-6-hydroxyphenol methylase/3-demethylubiquinol 3-O-methyltransferase UbiG [Brachymonas sp. J145]MEE1653526.1 bifunctional 2-polyprenyl-6-hydroxyphenol methylase/3-demethylubiquinol 3-O-methyltransferase UbiG [Brachymonas sp. J145]NLX17082.1 bifunctional 2-polyprenyl-6-hydroxyphenol methylase/3-demethylubiquinol 3-O-methyltransferase UbiG [Ramlibacter sp.]